MLAEYLDRYRMTFEMKCEGLDAEQLAQRSVPPSSMSLLGLVRHLAQVEHHWFRRFIEGQVDLPRLYSTEEDRDLDFNGAVADDAVVAEAWESWHREVPTPARCTQRYDDLGAVVGLGGRAGRGARHRRPHDRGVRPARRARRPAARAHRRPDRPVSRRARSVDSPRDRAATAHGWGLASVVTSGASEGTVLDTWFPSPALGEPPADATAPPTELAALAGDDPARRVRTEVVRVAIDLAEPPRDVPDAYLRLHLLSHRLVRPHGLNLDGIFGVLANVVWTSAGPCPVDGFEADPAAAARAAARCRSSASTSSRG